jgi:hypothetical protein
MAELVTGNAGWGTSYPPATGGVLSLEAMTACNMVCDSSADWVDQLIQGLLTFLAIVANFVPVVGTALSIGFSMANAYLSTYQYYAQVLNPPKNCTGCLVWGPTTQGGPSAVAPNSPYSGPSYDMPFAPPWFGTLTSVNFPGMPQSLSSMQVDDALWQFSILGDWTSSGKLNVLDTPFVTSPGNSGGVVLTPGPLPAGANSATSVPGASVAQFANVGTPNGKLTLQPLVLPPDVNYILPLTSITIPHRSPWQPASPLEEASR